MKNRTNIKKVFSELFDYVMPFFLNEIAYRECMKVLYRQDFLAKYLR